MTVQYYGKMSLSRYVFCLLLSLLLEGCSPCSPPMNWSHQTVEQRAAMAHRIVYATDVGHQNVVLNPLGASYNGQFDVHCVLKGDAFQSNPVTVADMGIIPHLCTSHTVKEGRSYFLFLMGSEEEVVTVHEVNYEIGVFDDLEGYREIFDREFEFYSRCFGELEVTTDPQDNTI
ncbi:coiled-coil domain-containing protein 3-like [Branchiostoma floridae x Branchiostoma japonicum]